MVLYRPRIQLSTGTESCENYRTAILAAGGEPLDGYCPEPNLSCDGLLLCGGGDIESALFGQEDRGSHPPDRIGRSWPCSTPFSKPESPFWASVGGCSSSMWPWVEP